MAIHLVTTRFCYSKMLLPVRCDSFLKTSSVRGCIKQVVNKHTAQTRNWMTGHVRCRHHHCSKSATNRILGRQPSNEPVLKQTKEYQKSVWRSSLFGRITPLRIYCTKSEPVAIANASKKVAVPKLSEIRRLLALAIPERRPLFFGICLLFISSAVTISVPFALGKVIDVIYTASQEGSGNMMASLTKLCSVLAVVFVCGAAANFGRIYLMNTSGQRIIKRLRESVFQSIIRQEIAFFDKTRTGELVNRLSTDSSVIGQSVTGNVSDGLRSLIQAMGGIGMMFYSSVKLASVVMTIVPPVAVLAIVYGRYVRNISKQVQDSLAKATEIAEERISSIRTVRAFSHESREMEAYSKKVDHVLDLSKKEAKLWGVFFGAMGLSGNMIILSVLYNGGMMMNESLITVGDLSAFIMYAAYVGISISGLSTFYTSLMKGIGASTRLWELLDNRPTIPIEGGSIPVLATLQGQLEFHKVNFAYPMRRDIPILTDLNLVVPAGKVTAVVGSSGSGKSTLGSLVLRYYDPDSGHISLDGNPIKSLDPKWLRHQIGTVSQDPILFSCSIAENIAYGAENPDRVTMEEIMEAAQTANAYGFVQSFTDKFDTVVGERGLMLSGGQRQRIALARAVLKNPRILLLDEATSALDAESEYLVQEALERLMVGRTVITIAHRLSTIKRAHAIAVLHNGTIAELGPYEQLMNYKDGVFRKLVEKQTVLND